MATRPPEPYQHPRDAEGPADSPVLLPWQSVGFPMVGNIVVDARRMDWHAEGAHAKFLNWLYTVVCTHIKYGCDDATVSVRYV